MRLIVFDLDYTLWNGKTHQLYPEVKQLLAKLRSDKNNIMTIATHNLHPMRVLKHLDIKFYFHAVVKGRCDKNIMIQELMNKYNTPQDIIFIDDQLLNMSIVTQRMPFVKCIWCIRGFDSDDYDAIYNE